MNELAGIAAASPRYMAFLTADRIGPAARIVCPDGQCLSPGSVRPAIAAGPRGRRG